MLIGYMRPNEDDQTCDMQMTELRKLNCGKIIAEEHSSAKKRVQLINMIDDLKQGDKIIITKLFSLADSTRHLVELLQVIEEKGANIQSLKEGIDTSNRSGYQFSYIVKHLVEFQSDVISEKTKKGLRNAQKKGVTTGRPRKPDENVQRAIIMYESKKYSLAEIRDETGISKSTLYRYLES
ncbi:recombinase family protein [Sporosarcina soli]|uniref:Recombinase family protein n=1 Tax=Sporosarcina soli TaxID=334736 RepID=A0ABW0TRN4_9BACL